MSKILKLACLMVFFLGIGAPLAHAADQPGKIDLKVGDTAWFCACDKCPCETIARKPAKCGCNVDLVKGTVTAVDAAAGTVTASLPGGTTKTFKTTGKYTCACGPACDCGMVSQNPGNCACNKPMTAVSPAPTTGGYGAPAPAAAPAPATGGYGAPAPKPATGGYGR